MTTRPFSMPAPTKILTALSVWLCYDVRPHVCTVTVSKQGRSFAFKQKFVLKASKKIYEQPECYAIRDSFFNILSVEDATEFLRLNGPFRAEVFETTYEELLKWQEFFREYLLFGVDSTGVGPIAELGDTENDRIGGLLSWDIGVDRFSGKLHAYVHCDSVVEAIGATIALDLLEGSKFAACGWCKSIFEITKNNGRLYCTPDCAHRAGQKRRRAVARALKTASTKKQLKKTKKGN